MTPLTISQQNSLATSIITTTANTTTLTEMIQKQTGEELA